MGIKTILIRDTKEKRSYLLNQMAVDEFTNGRYQIWGLRKLLAIDSKHYQTRYVYNTAWELKWDKHL